MILLLYIEDSYHLFERVWGNKASVMLDGHVSSLLTYLQLENKHGRNDKLPFCTHFDLKIIRFSIIISSYASRKKETFPINNKPHKN